MAVKKKKGMSMEEKANTMLSIFHETKDVLNYKEVEKLSIKKNICEIKSFSNDKRYPRFVGL
jgi:hypothetical protein